MHAKSLQLCPTLQPHRVKSEDFKRKENTHFKAPENGESQALHSSNTSPSGGPNPPTHFPASCRYPRQDPSGRLQHP